MTADRLTLQAIALNRFGLGARPHEAASSDPGAFLLAQLEPPTAEATTVFPSARDTARTFLQYESARKAVRTGSSPPSETRKIVAAAYEAEVGLRLKSALSTKAPFRERLVHFWSNHFAVSADKPQVTVLAGDFERTAIRPHVTGKFEDMLVAVEQHPAMQIYLDQRRSTGPNSLVAKASNRPTAAKRGINENLAREILELHTLGVRSGYSQEDVIQFALAMTGWSVGINPEKETVGFVFNASQHEPGPKTVVGKTYGQDGYPQALAVMKDLARSDATALHIATKLARHFIADDPPPAVVERLRGAYLASGGDLSEVYRALIASDAAWKEQRVKFKTPWEWMVSMLRACGLDAFDALPTASIFRQLGQPIWQPRSPAGYDDVADSWAAPDALVRRVELAQRVLGLLPDHERPQQLIKSLALGPLDSNTVTQVKNAETIDSGLTLLFMSPEFLRR